MIHCILSKSNDPYFNLAAEEYLLRQSDTAFYFQYVNEPSVIIGKHQNLLAEMDLDYIEAEGILPARRISGGGAVYHDHGNMNYSFITNESPGNYIRFARYTTPVIQALKNWNVEAHLGKRNEILTGNQKISGTASHVYKHRVLHHGTLLYDADLDKLSNCLYNDKEGIQDKAVRSVRSEVTNIRNLMKIPPEKDKFYRDFFMQVMEIENGREYKFSETDLKVIQNLANEKYKQWEWIYGYSPRFELDRTRILDGEKVQIHLVVEKGIIKQFDLSSVESQSLAEIARCLPGTRHTRMNVLNALLEKGIDDKTVNWIQDALF